MSRVTRCPQCETLFKVVPDQLRLSQGWVRCGSCGTVFDASEQMQHAHRHDTTAGNSDGLSHPVWSLLLRDRSAGKSQPASHKKTKTDSQYPPVLAEKSADMEEYLDSESAPTTVVLTDSSFPEDDLSEDQLSEVNDAVWSSSAPPPEPVFVTEGVQEKPHSPPASPTTLADKTTDADSAKALRLATLQASADALDTGSGTGFRESHSQRLASRPPQTVPGKLNPSSTPIPPLFQKPSAEESVPGPIGTSRVDLALDDPMDHEIWSASPSGMTPPEAPPETSASEEVQRHNSEVTPSFVKEARRRQFWRKPLVRMALGLVGVASIAAGGLAWAHQQRDWIAATYPDTRPLLLQMCHVLQCRIQPYRKLESIAIQHSEFNRLPTGNFQLSLSIRNQDNMTLAMPSLSLTLTNAADQTVTQRVLTPAQLKAPTELRARRDWSGNLVIQLDGPETEQISGYRLQAFYP